MRRDLQVFFNVNLKLDDKFRGISASLLSTGNFFLAPLRSFCKGKAVQMQLQQDEGKQFYLREGSFAKVSSFYSGFSGQHKFSKQGHSLLHATNYGQGLSALFFWGIQGLAVIPGTVLGFFFKGLAYCASPKIRAAHQITKSKLTPQELYITTSNHIDNDLQARVNSGQATSTLVIDAVANNKRITQNRLSLIKNVNATKSVFTGGTWALEANAREEILTPETATIFVPQKKRQKWDLSALEAVANNPAAPETADTANKPTTLKTSLDEALAFPGPKLFSRSIKKHTILMRVDTEEEKQKRAKVMSKTQ